jgi:hypothetical protein
MLGHVPFVDDQLFVSAHFIVALLHSLSKTNSVFNVFFDAFANLVKVLRSVSSTRYTRLSRVTRLDLNESS